MRSPSWFVVNAGLLAFAGIYLAAKGHPLGLLFLLPAGLGVYVAVNRYRGGRLGVISFRRNDPPDS